MGQIKKIDFYIDFDNYHYGLLDTIDNLFYLDTEINNEDLSKKECPICTNGMLFRKECYTLIKD